MRRYKPFIGLLVGFLILMAIVGWGIGWAARAFFDKASRLPAVPALTLTPSAIPNIIPPTEIPNPDPTPGLAKETATSTPTLSPSAPHSPTITLQPTSTPRPESTPTPGVITIIVRSGQTVYGICRNCESLYTDLRECVEHIAKLNGKILIRRNWQLNEGERLKIPAACAP